MNHYRAIILILASNESSLSKNGRKVWHLYKDIDPTIKVFFVYGKLFEPLLDYDESCDIIFDNISERYPVTFEKTFRAMEIIQKKITYDFFIRTNISTFWDFEKLHLHLNILPRNNCYSGDGPFKGGYLSGTDTIVTPEMIDAMISNPHLVKINAIDDKAMGFFFHGYLNVPFLPNRICFFEDIVNVNEESKVIDRIKTAQIENKDHYRVKTLNGDREDIDIFIYEILLNKIYNIKINMSLKYMTTLIAHIYNEEYLLPFWLEHHKKIFDAIIIIDYNSTDRSVEICKDICPNCKIIPSKNKVFDAELADAEIMDIERKIEGIKMSLNITEFMLCEKSIKDLFQEGDKQNKIISDSINDKINIINNKKNKQNDKKNKLKDKINKKNKLKDKINKKNKQNDKIKKINNKINKQKDKIKKINNKINKQKDKIKKLEGKLTFDNKNAYGVISWTPYSNRNYEINNYHDLFHNLKNDDILFHQDRQGVRTIHNYADGNYSCGRHNTHHQIKHTTKLHIIWMGFYPMNEHLLARKLQIKKKYHYLIY